MDGVSLTPNSSVAVAIRSEGIDLQPAESISADANLWQGTVSLVTFAGAYCHYQIDTDAGLRVEALTPAPPVLLNTGERVALRVAPESIMLLDS